MFGVEVPLEVHRPKKLEFFFGTGADEDENDDVFSLREGSIAEATSFESGWEGVREGPGDVAGVESPSTPEGNTVL
ncbi:hypothetical protein PQX77_020421 [Marasmius sp. AFHP31]|nr:hypothetical protein PQX77_020421 [Marasmius sp. AFHP31]